MSSFGSFDSGGLSGGGIISINFAVVGAPEAAAEIDQVTLAEDELEASTGRGAAAQARFGKAMRESTFSAGFLGKGLSILEKWGKRVGLALGISGALLLANGMKFEQQMATVSAVTGAHGKQLQSLGNLAMSESMKSQFSATAAAKAEELLGRASFKTNQIMALLPPTLNLATAAQGNLNETTTLMGETLLAFDLSASKGAHVADVLADATRNGAMSMDDIVQAMKYVGAAAYGSHQPLEDIVGLMKLMALHGVKGSLAGTTLRYALTRLVKPVKQVEDGLKLINMHASDLYGPHGLKPLPTILDTMYQRMKAIGNVNRQKVLVDVFGVRALSGMNALFNQGPAAWKAAIEQMKNSKGLAAQMAAAMNNTVPRQFTMVLHAIENIGTLIYLNFEPKVLGVLKRVNKAFSPLIKHIGQFQALIEAGNYHDAIMYADELTKSHGHLATMLFIVTDFFGQLWTTITNLWKIFKPFVVIGLVGAVISLKALTILMNLFNKYSKVTVPLVKALVAGYIAWKIVTGAVAIAQWALNGAMAANPVLLIIEVIALLVLGLYELYEHVKIVHTVVDFLFNFFKDHWMILADIIGGPFFLVISQIIQHWQSVMSFFRAFGSEMKSIAKGMWDWIYAPFVAVIDKVWQYFKPIYDKIMKVVGLLPGGGGGSGQNVGGIHNPGGRYGPSPNNNPAQAAINSTMLGVTYGAHAQQNNRPTASLGNLPPKKVEPFSNPLNGDWDADGVVVHATIPVYLDKKKVAESTAKVTSDKRARKTGKRSALDQLQTVEP